MRLNIHGAGLNTNLTLALAVAETKASLTCRGTLAQNVRGYDWEAGHWRFVEEGKGSINTSLNFSLDNSSTTKGTVSSNFTQFAREDGAWVEVFKGKGKCSLTSRETDTEASVEFTWSPSWGLRAGEGLYWQAYNSTGAIRYNYDDNDWYSPYELAALVLTETSRTSDGMTTRLQTTAGGGISGWLKGRSHSIIANFKGDYLEGTGTIDWVDSDIPDEHMAPLWGPASG